MANIINESFFILDLNAPNTSNTKVQENLSAMIKKFEPECLQLFMGYPLYKAFLAETDTLIQRHIIGGYLRNDEQIKVGTTVGLITGATSFTFDGTSGKPDYRGYKIVPSELNGRGILALDEDYSWNKDTGEFNLLFSEDEFSADTIYNIHFEPAAFIFEEGGSGGSQTDRMLKILYGGEFTNYYGELDYWRGLVHDTDQSMIANYVYYKMQEIKATHSSGINTIVPKGENAQNISPADKMVSAWNGFSEDCIKFFQFIHYYNKQDTPLYPEITPRQIQTSARVTSKINIFGI